VTGYLKEKVRIFSVEGAPLGSATNSELGPAPGNIAKDAPEGLVAVTLKKDSKVVYVRAFDVITERRDVDTGKPVEEPCLSASVGIKGKSTETAGTMNHRGLGNGSTSCQVAK
jgi:hypothetical protein